MSIRANLCNPCETSLGQSLASSPDSATSEIWAASFSKHVRLPGSPSLYETLILLILSVWPTVLVEYISQFSDKIIISHAFDF